MQKIAPDTRNEQDRMKALQAYAILDTPPEDSYNDISALAANLCNAPMSFISFIDNDRQWFKATHGMQIDELAGENILTQHSLTVPRDVFVISDLTKEKHYRDHVLVKRKPKAKFYAGVTLQDADGCMLGTLAVMDTEPRKLSKTQAAMLRSLGQQVELLLELRKKETELKQKQAELCHAYGDLEKIAHIASHDLKSPLNNIISLTHLLNDGYSKKLDEEGNEYISFLNAASYQLSDLVSGIVSYARSSQTQADQAEEINVSLLIEEVISSLSIPNNATVKYKKNAGCITAPRLPLKIILTQLVHNAVRHNDSEKIKVEVAFEETEHAYSFEVKDNGYGIAIEDREKIFDLFERLNKEKDGESMGIGLAIARRLAEKCRGRITLTSKPGKGTQFVLTLPK